MVDIDSNVKELKGVGAKTAKSLEENGRGTVKRLATANPDDLPENTSLGEKKAEDLVKKARKVLTGGNRFQTGLDVEKEQENMSTISTGSQEFDKLMKGGIGSEYLTEAYGLSSSGKTQLAFQLSVNAQLPEDACRCTECGETSLSEEEYKEKECCDDKPEEDIEKIGSDNGNQVVFIDVEETFRADRIRTMAKSHGLDPDKALENIHVTRTKDLADQEQAVEEVRNLELENVALIVIDSFVGHIRAEFEGRAEYGERSNRLGNMLSELQKIASNHGIAVFYTNQAGEDPGVQYGDPVYAYGGAIMQHRSSFRLRLDERGSKGYNAELIDSPNIPQGDIYFSITKHGIRDQDYEVEQE